MNYEDLTLKDLFALKNLLNNNESNTSEKNLSEQMYGKKVMVRTYSAGVHFGTLKEKVGQQAILTDSRRVHYWTKAASLYQLAMEGSKDIGDCRIAMVVNEILLDRVIEVIPMTKEAIKNLYGSREWKC